MEYSHSINALLMQHETPPIYNLGAPLYKNIYLLQNLNERQLCFACKLVHFFNPGVTFPCFRAATIAT